MITASVSSRSLHAARRGLTISIKNFTTSCRCAPKQITTSSPPQYKIIINESISTRRTFSTASSSPITSAQESSSGGVDGIAGKVFFSSLCLLTFGLGSWQTKRYYDKIDMVQKRDDDLALDPLPSLYDWQMLQQSANLSSIGSNKTDAKEKSYRRVCLQGTYQHNKQLLIGPRGPPPGALAESGPNSGRGGGGMASSAQGYWVITPFAITDGDNNDDDSGNANVERKRQGWFGRKKSESTTKQSSPIKDSNDKDQTIVWINRGWIPRNYVNKQNQITTQWDEPSGAVQLVAMESKTETPGTFSPPSRLDNTKPLQQNSSKGDDEQPTIEKLLWMDRNAMEEATSTTKDYHPSLFVEINTNETTAAANDDIIYPVKPTREFVGEFKIPPSVHVGYAVTWFGLSSAGMVMTRKLLTRGR